MVASYASLFTAKEYLALESVAETKHEFCGGRILSMASAEPEHNLIAGNVQAERSGPGARHAVRLASALRTSDIVNSNDVKVTARSPRAVEDEDAAIEGFAQAVGGRHLALITIGWPWSPRTDAAPSS